MKNELFAALAATPECDLVADVAQWAHDRNFHNGATFEGQVLKLLEEHGELAHAHNKRLQAKIVDGIGDIMVVCIVLQFMARMRFGIPLDQSRFITKFATVNSGNPAQALFGMATKIGQIGPAAGHVDVYADESSAETVIRLSRMVWRIACEYALLAGIDPLDALKAAYAEIKDRKGKMIDGRFFKEEDLLS